MYFSLVYLLVALQAVFLAIVQPFTGAHGNEMAIAGRGESSLATISNLDNQKRAVVDINIVTPALLITIPFSIQSGPSSVSGTITIYFQASRSVRAVGGPTQRYLAHISITTFFFEFEYQYTSSVPGHSRLQWKKDTLYLHRVEAEIQALNVSFGGRLTID